MPEVVVRGIKLHAQRLGEDLSGTKPVAVFLHGLVMDNLSSWYFSVAHPASRVADVLLYDLRGHGLSERPKHGYGLADMIADLAGLLDAMGISRPVTLIGNSFGGLLAVAFALKFPERVAGLVLVDGHLGDDGFARQMAATLRLTGDERDSRIAESFKHWLGRHSERKANKLADNARALVEGTSLVDDMADTPTLTATDLASLPVSILALYGEHSDLRALAEKSLAGARNVDLRIMAGCTHSILWEATVAVREEIIAFLGARSC